LTFKNIGLGTQKVEKEVISFFPSARVLRIDSGQLGKKDFQDYVYQEFTNKKIDVLIGTQMITKGWDLPALSLVGIIDADNMLSLPDFRTNEKAFYDLMQLFGRVARPGAIFPGLAIIQTYHPENHLFKLAAEKNYATYVAEELKNRKALSYPPFGRIAKLLFQDYNKAKVVKETDMVYTALDKVGLGVSISAPSESFVDKIRGRHRKQIIIKFKESLSPELSAVLRTLPQGWVIDIDPISII
jgi:primosomal protein N' (replication factor Y)